MAPSSNRKTRSSRKKRDENKYENLQSLTLSDVQCTACMGIFIEPVTLPCYHAMCKECFQKTIDNNSLSCPLCRKYVGSWIRKVQKTGKLVNDNLWLYVQTKFAIHVQKKMAGEEDEEMEDLARQFVPTPQICLPGEIRQEYEAEQEKAREESRKRERAELEASEKLILKLQEVEASKREAERKEILKREEEDAQIAKQLAEELENQARELEVRSAFVSLNKKAGPSNQPSHSVVRGPMDAFVSQSPAITRTDSSCSNDSLKSEMQHFKPLVTAPCTPPKTHPNGKAKIPLPIRVPVMRDFDAIPGTSRQSLGTQKSPLRPWVISGSTPTTSKNQSSKGVLKRPSDESAANSPKRPCPDRIPDRIPDWIRTNVDEDDDEDEGYAGSDRSKEQDGTEVDGTVLPLSESELRLQLAAAERMRQERLDRDLAMRLQAELNAESAPTYKLRSADIKSTPHRKAQPRKKATSAPRDNRRQRTLEETIAVSRHSLRNAWK